MSGLPSHRFEQRRLQVAAMDRPSRARRSGARASSPSGMRASVLPRRGLDRDRRRARPRRQRSRWPSPSAIRMRVALGESWMPAPVSSSRSACSSSATRKPRCASVSAAVRPPMPAPAIDDVARGRHGRARRRAQAGFGQRAASRPRRMRHRAPDRAGRASSNRGR